MLVLINAYIVGSITNPAQPLMRDWGQSNCFKRDVCTALIFEKSGLGNIVGGFLKNPTASS
jgi:hypothetical protein